MALIKCPECGKEISDQAVACPNCGFAVKEKNMHYTNAYGPFGTPAMCLKCKSQHLSLETEQLSYQTKGRQEERKKSIITRTANNAGRASMVLATGGLWLLTPKKSKYSTTKKENTKIKSKKILTCLDCGYSWKC